MIPFRKFMLNEVAEETPVNFRPSKYSRHTDTDYQSKTHHISRRAYEFDHPTVKGGVITVEITHRRKKGEKKGTSHVGFTYREPGKADTYDLTGKGAGSAGKIFGGVQHVLRHHAKEFPTHSVEWTARKSEGKRGKLYAKIAKRATGNKPKEHRSTQDNYREFSVKTESVIMEDLPVRRGSKGATIYSGADAEHRFNRKMGGRVSRKKAGSHRTDIVISHPDHGTHSAEMKSGGTIDYAQQRFKAEGGGLVRTTAQHAGNVARRIDRLARGYSKRAGPLRSGTTKRTRTSKKTGEKKTERVSAAASQIEKYGDKRVRMNFKNKHDMMSGHDAVHIYVHSRTGEAVAVPNKRKHHGLGKKMGLKKTVSHWSLSRGKSGKQRSGSYLRGFRRKGSTINASHSGSSDHMVNTVRDRGGHVFQSLDHLAAHLKKHGWSASTGHKN